MPQPSRARRLLAAGVLLVTTSLLVVVLPPTTASAEPLQYRPPVPGEIVSPFDLPAQAWQPGNRGIDYAPPPGTPVTASADGEVVFAGSVGGPLHVTVQHADGLRTSYSFLAQITVAKGARVRAGEPIGVAGGPIHFGVRTPDGTYLDPAALLAGLLQGRPVLVPGRGEGADPLVERRHFLDVLVGTGLAAVTSVAGGLVEVGDALVDNGIDFTALVVDRAVVTVEELVALARDLVGDCTPPSTPTPRNSERRIVVEVSGLGTGSPSNSAWQLPADELGYADGDVVRFSYAGGRALGDDDPNPYVEGDPGLAGIEARSFDGLDSQRSLPESAAALNDLLVEIARREPGVPIDVIAHSQGGVVSRLAIDQGGRDGRLPDEVENLVTLGSPHGGAWLADGVDGLQQSELGEEVVNWMRQEEFQDPLDPALPAIGQLTTRGSPVAEVHDRPLPDGVRFTSIAARWDYVVPADQTRDAAADRHVIIDTTDAWDAHSDIPRSPQAVREVALAVNDRPPTCQGVRDRVVDFMASGTIGNGERLIARGLQNSAPLVDRVPVGGLDGGG